MTFYGADVSQLRDLAKAADKAASLLSSQASSLQGQIQSAPWKGADGERFRQEWTGSHRPNLEQVASTLRHNSKLLLQHADEQERSSAGSSGGAGTGDAGSSGGEGAGPLDNIVNDGLNWLEQRVKEAAEAKERHHELEQDLGRMVDASPEEQAKWWDGLSAEDRRYLIEGEDNNDPFARQLMLMDGGIPESAQAQAMAELTKVASKDIPRLVETDKAELEYKAAWLHGGAAVGAKVQENMDGSATMKVYGNLGIGVNDPSGTAGITGSSEVSREYKFDTAAQALAARDRMMSDLPPDELSEVTDMAGSPPAYILDTVNDAARDNGATGHDDKFKGTLSMKAQGDSSGASGSAQLDLAYERSMTHGTATASSEVSAQGKLDLDGHVCQASGKGGMEVKLDAGNNMESISVSMEGTMASGGSAGLDGPGGKAESTFTAGTQGTVKIDVDYSDNKELVDSYVRNIATGNIPGAASDAAKLYEAGSATVQLNHVATATHEVGLDFEAAKVGLKTESQVVVNQSTYHKVANDSSLNRMP
ncbi:hypothetical protein M1E17_21290 [Arthrobacter sp. D1-29]